MKNMSRKDDAAFTGQGMGETPRTDDLRVKLRGKPWSDSYMEMMCQALELERELNQANAIIKECLQLLPVGYTPYHTPESLPSRISSVFEERSHYRKERDAARSYKQVMKRENERLRQVESKLTQERNQLHLALSSLIALRERETQTGQPISGEEWEIAGYALESKSNKYYEYI
jgi:hypothetical protein